MSNWGGELTAEEAYEMGRVFHALRLAQPRGWSVVRGAGEIVIRPEQRGVGKISVHPPRGDEIVVAFFSRRRNHWAGWGRFPLDGLDPQALFARVRSEVQRDSLRLLP